MTRTRMAPDLRKDQIVEKALELASEHGYKQLTRNQVGAACGIGATGVQYHFPTMPQLQRAVMRAAVKLEQLDVLAQGLVAGDPQANKAGRALQEKALQKVLT